MNDKKFSNNKIQHLEATSETSIPLKAKIVSSALPDLILCDQSASIHCISYNKQINSYLKKDNFIMIVNYVLKVMDDALTLLITDTTKVFLTTEFNINKEVLEKAQSIPSAPILTIKEAKASPKKRKITIEGKVIQVSPIKKVKNDKIELKKVTLKDTTDTIQVSLWKDQAHLNVAQGMPMIFKSLQTSTFKNKPVLSSTNSTTIELSKNQDLDLLSDDDEDDVDSEQAEVVAVENLYKYMACQDDSCRLKKLDDNVCPKCYKSYATPEYTAKQAVVLTVGVLKEDNFVVYTLFTHTFKNLFPQIAYEDVDTRVIIDEILKSLPLKISFKVNNDIITETNVVQ